MTASIKTLLKNNKNAAFFVLSAFLFSLPFLVANQPQELRSQAQTVPSPACLGGCPVDSPTTPPASNNKGSASTPCFGLNSNANKRSLSTNANNGNGGFLSVLINLILQLLNQLLGGGGGGIPSNLPSGGIPNGNQGITIPTQAPSDNQGQQPAPTPCPTDVATPGDQGSEAPQPTDAPTDAQPTAEPQGNTTGPIPTPAIGGNFNLVFDDEFDGNNVDTSKWSFTSSAERNCDANGCSNPQNQQLEYDTGDNCTVSGGILTITARRESKGGQDWTSCMLHSKPQFQYMYMEERSKFPSAKGFWPGFWTWNGPSQEIDVYEFYSDNHTKLYMTSHASGGGGCKPTPPFDPSGGFHTYGADITPNGVTFYVDGQQVCTAQGTLSQNVSILDDMFVYSKIPPDSSTNSETKQIDYIRAWQRQ